MFAAPLIAVAAIALIPLWPVAIVLMALVRILFLPVALIASAMGNKRWADKTSTMLSAAFLLVLKPWSYFD